MSLFSVIKGLFGFKTGLSAGDRMLVCDDCRKEFVFDAGEQAFFKIKGFTDPKRCPRCRKKVKFRMKKGGSNRPSGQGNGQNNQRNNFKSRGRSAIDSRSPYVDER